MLERTLGVSLGGVAVVLSCMVVKLGLLLGGSDWVSGVLENNSMGIGSSSHHQRPA